MQQYTHLYDILLDRKQRFPDAVALGGQQQLEWRTLTSRQLLDAAERLARELAALGVGAGDRVVLWVPNAWRTPVYLFACWRLGAVVVPFDREMHPEAARRILALVAPRLVLLGYDERPAWVADTDPARAWWEPGAGPAGAVNGDLPRPQEALAAIFFTSGTTGQPKGCMITHANLLAQVAAFDDRIPLDPSCRLASILPLSHLFEFTCGLLYPLACGAAIHYIPSRAEVVRVLNEQRITHMIAVPQLLALMGATLETRMRARLRGPLYDAAMKLADRLPLAARRKLPWNRLALSRIGGAFRMLASGGAALAPETHRLWERLGVRVVQGYGTSECAPVVACGLADGSTPLGTVGRPIRGVEVRLSPEGELLVRGPNVMRGYWQDPDRTAEVLDADGWYHTGDLAEIDAVGNIRLSGRAKDLIVLPSGMNVWPQDVEDTFRQHPAVKDACVLAVPTPGGGATLHVYLIPSADTREDPLAVAAQCNARLAQHQRVASAAWWPEPDFPRTTGLLKVRRHLLPLPNPETTDHSGVVLAADDPVAQAVAVAARATHVRDIDRLVDLGLDSLALVELAVVLEEKTGVAVREESLSAELTVAELRTLVARHATDAGAPAALDAHPSAASEPPLWPFTWGRALRRPLCLPFDLLYAACIPRTHVLGAEHLANVPDRVVLAGVHRSFVDIVLVRIGLRQTPAHALADRLVIAAGADGLGWRSLWAHYGMLAFGLYPLRQRGRREESLRGLVRVVQHGNALLLFPQGEHTHRWQETSDPPTVRFRTGVAHLAQALDSVVVPFGLAGPERVMPMTLEGFRGPVIAGIPVRVKRHPLAIAFGAPLRRGPDEDPHTFTARLGAACYDLAGAAERALDGADGTGPSRGQAGASAGAPPALASSGR